MVRRLLFALGSPRLAVLIMAALIVLIFAGTWAQVSMGIWHVLDKYFRSVVVWVPLQIFLPRGPQVGGGFPWPGGTTLGILLLVNLLAAHAVRFKWRLKRIGILLTHIALILLIVGEFATALLAQETQMAIYEGETVNWSHDVREVELAVLRRGENGRDDVIALNQPLLQMAAASGYNELDVPGTPLRLRIDRFYQNAAIARRAAAAPPPPAEARGFLQRFTPVPLAPATGVSTQMIDLPAAEVTVFDTDERRQRGAALGTWLLSPRLEARERRAAVQTFEHDGAEYGLVLRFRRHYRSYEITLDEFRHDLYPGTNTPSNYSSAIHLVDPPHSEDRKILIYMNSPLRYRGETFFQSSYLSNDQGTVLQVVDNPGWLIPYIACAIGGLGLLLHFMLSLITFLMRRLG